MSVKSAEVKKATYGMASLFRLTSHMSVPFVFSSFISLLFFLFPIIFSVNVFVFHQVVNFKYIFLVNIGTN